MSHTHTTSAAPAPALSPATVALSSTAKSIIALLHSDSASPELLFHLNARDLPALRTAAVGVSAFLKGRKEALVRYLAEDETKEVRVSEKTRTFWLEKKSATEEFLSVLDDADKSDSELSETGRKAREEYFEKTKAAWEVGLALVLNNVCKEFVGPFALGTPVMPDESIQLTTPRFYVCRGTDIDCRCAPRRMVARTGDFVWGQWS